MMEITLNLNVNMPKLVELIEKLMATAASGQAPARPAAPAPAAPKPPVADSLSGEPNPPAFLKKELEAKAASDALDGPKPPKAKRSAKEAPAAAASTSPAAVANPDELTLEIVRARLSDYSADKRYGMNGVFKILADFGVDRITALPKDRYADFKQVIDEALAKPPVDPLA